MHVEAVDLTKLRESEILVQVRVASICGTDLRISKHGHCKIAPGARRAPGHEAGEIVEVGRLIIEYREGMRVFVTPNMGCGSCVFCWSGYNSICPRYEAFGISIDGGFQ
jgi:D-arabinose 1-dehydrogenase-like Zn-dependent alcohol dehydrogenase